MNRILAIKEEIKDRGRGSSIVETLRAPREESQALETVLR